jgi:hypothetical protein
MWKFTVVPHAKYNPIKDTISGSTFIELPKQHASDRISSSLWIL